MGELKDLRIFLKSFLGINFQIVFGTYKVESRGVFFRVKNFFFDEEHKITKLFVSMYFSIICCLFLSISMKSKTIIEL